MSKGIITQVIGAVVDVKFDGDGRSIQQVQVQNSNTLNVVKRERQNSESQARRKGITK